MLTVSNIFNRGYDIEIELKTQPHRWKSAAGPLFINGSGGVDYDTLCGI